MQEIHNKKTKEFLEFFFKKSLRNISKEEVNEVQSFSISGDSEKFQLDLEDLVIFPNLKTINIYDAMVSASDIEMIRNISSIRFHRCSFENEEDLSSLTSVSTLEFLNCYFVSYDFLKKLSQLESLAIVKPESEKKVCCGDLSDYQHLNFLNLSYCRLEDFSKILSCSELKILDVLGVDLPDDCLDIIKKFSKLEKVFIDSRYYDFDFSFPFKIYSNYRDFLFDDDDELEITNEKVF